MCNQGIREQLSVVFPTRKRRCQLMNTFRLLTMIVMISFSLALVATHASAGVPDSSLVIGQEISFSAECPNGSVIQPPGERALPPVAFDVNHRSNNAP
jgi:hypothetical protein